MWTVRIYIYIYMLLFWMRTRIMCPLCCRHLLFDCATPSLSVCYRSILVARANWHYYFFCQLSLSVVCCFVIWWRYYLMVCFLDVGLIEFQSWNMSTDRPTMVVSWFETDYSYFLEQRGEIKGGAVPLLWRAYKNDTELRVTNVRNNSRVTTIFEVHITTAFHQQ